MSNDVTYLNTEKKPTPRNVADLHRAIMANTDEDLPDLTPTQQLRMTAASMLVRESEMAIDFDDPTEFGKVLAELCGWVLWGPDYNTGSRN